MWAIVDVLGDAVTAGGRRRVGRGVLADGLRADQPGARAVQRARGRPETVWRQWEVEEKIRETDDVVTFVVKRIDDRLVKTSLPGQYVTVQMPMPDGVRQPRQYSLTRADDGEHRQFSVKWVARRREARRRGVHPAAHSVDVGDVLTMSLPFGDVVLDDSGRPVVFASAGIGITPMAGMLSHLVTAGSQPADHCCCTPTSTRQSFALRRQVLDDIAALPNASTLRLVRAGRRGQPRPVDGVFAGMMDLAQVDLPDDAGYYLCGPLPFMQAVRSALIDEGVRTRGHPVRGVRPGPVAGRLRVAAAPWPRSESAHADAGKRRLRR